MRVAWLPASLKGGLRCACSPVPVVSNAASRLVRFPTKQFSTSTKLDRRDIAISHSNDGTAVFGAVNAAKPINFEEDVEVEDERIFYARLVPESPAYFSAQPNFTDDLLVLQELLGRYSALPVVNPGDAPRVAWRTLQEYRNVAGETVGAAKYHKIIQILHRLNQIHPTLMPAGVTEVMNEYKRDINPFQRVEKIVPIDSLGRTIGAGRRKASTARAWLVEGSGEVLVNGKTLAEHFGRIHDRESAIWALKATDRVNKYNVWALVTGGGTTGQAEALTLAVGKALLAHEPALKPALRRAGCVTRDPRRVERKKPGHVKARKMPAWVKR